VSFSATSSVLSSPDLLIEDDYLANSYIKRHKGIYEPEVRLWMIWISDAFMIGGLIFLGFALQELLPWIATAFAWAIYVFGAVDPDTPSSANISSRPPLPSLLTASTFSLTNQLRQRLGSTFSELLAGSLSITFNCSGHRI